MPEDNIRRQSSLGTEIRRIYNESENMLRLMLAQVIKVNPRYNTVDIQSVTGTTRVSKSGLGEGKYSAKLPVQYGGRTPEGKPYGQTTPVEVGSLVLVGFVDGYKYAPVVLSVYSDTDEARELSRSPVSGADPRDSEMKKHTQHDFTVYPSLTYKDIDGEGNYSVSFTGKSFFVTDTDVDPDMGGVTDDGIGTQYEDLDSSYYYSGELIEPKNGAAPSLLFRHTGNVEAEDGRELPDDHVTMMNIAQDGTFRTSVLKEEEDWRSYFEISEDGTIKLRRQNDSQAVGQGFDAHELSVTDRGIIFRSGDRYVIFNGDGFSGDTGLGGGGNYDSDIRDLKDDILSMGTSIEQTDEYIRMSAEKVEQIDDRITEYEATFEITAEQIESRVTETVTDLYDGELEGLANDIKELNESAEKSLDTLEGLSDDNIITAMEKQILQLEVQVIKAEYPNYVTQGEIVGIDTEPYTKAYDRLIDYIAPILEDTEVSSNIDRVIFMANFEEYFAERSDLLYNVFKTLKDELDMAAQEAIDAGVAAGEASTDAAEARGHADRANNLLSDIAADDKVTPQEKKDLRREYDRILNEWEEYEDNAAEYEVNTINFLDAKDAVIEFMESTGVLDDMTVTTELNGAVLTHVYAEYYEERNHLITGIQKSTREALLAFEGTLEYHETSITETSREISLMAQSVKIMEQDIEISRAEISIQSDRIRQSVSRVEIYREINQNVADYNSIGTNLFSESQSSNGELDPETGRVTFDRDNTMVSPYLQIESGRYHTLTAFGSTETNVLVNSWYDAQRNHIESETIGGQEDPLILESDSPANAKYARVSTRNADRVQLQFELGAVATPYKASPQDTVGNLDVAQEEYERRKALLQEYETLSNDVKAEHQADLELVNSLLEDSVWDQEERNRVVGIMDRVETRHSQVLEDASLYRVGTTAYEGSYSALVTHVNPLLDSTEEYVFVTPGVINSLFSDFYDQRDRLYTSIENMVYESYLASERILDEVSDSALAAQQLAEQLASEAERIAREADLVREAIREAEQVERSVMSSIGDIVADGIVTPVEKVYADNYQLDIAGEIQSLVTQANVYALSTNNLTTSYAMLSSYLSPMLTPEGSREETEVDPTTFSNRFQEYFNAKENILYDILAGAEGKYEEVNAQALRAQQEYLRRQDQQVIYQNAIIDAQFAIDRVSTRIEEVANNVTYGWQITSSNGNMFFDSNIDTILTARMFKGSEDITDTIAPESYRWTKILENGEPDEEWNFQHKDVGNVLELNHEDVQHKATFEIEVI